MYSARLPSRCVNAVHTSCVSPVTHRASIETSCKSCCCTWSSSAGNLMTAKSCWRDWVKKFLQCLTYQLPITRVAHSPHIRSDILALRRGAVLSNTLLSRWMKLRGAHHVHHQLICLYFMINVSQFSLLSRCLYSSFIILSVRRTHAAVRQSKSLLKNSSPRRHQQPPQN